MILRSKNQTTGLQAGDIFETWDASKINSTQYKVTRNGEVLGHESDSEDIDTTYMSIRSEFHFIRKITDLTGLKFENIESKDGYKKHLIK